jgi:hypothetical protein
LKNKEKNHFLILGNEKRIFFVKNIFKIKPMNKYYKSDYARYDMTEIEQKYFDLIDKYECYIGDDDDNVMTLLICLIIDVQEKNNERLKSLEARVYSLEMLELNKNGKKTSSCCVIC